MKSPIALVIIIILCQFLYSENKIKYQFPKDHFAHKGFQTEWWYYTGHLRSSNGQKFGYELTFFKVEWSKYKNERPPDWNPRPVYLAHFALSDIQNKKFYYSEKISRPLGNISGANTKKYHLWNNDWSVKAIRNTHYLKAQSNNFSISLQLTPQKHPVIHGKNGKSLKSNNKNDFSFYYSYTNLSTIGTISLNGTAHQCTGLSWMDHEWMSNRQFYNNSSPKWDWFSIQLNNNTEIMFYIIRDNKNNPISVSSGSIVDPIGNKTHLSNSDVRIKPLDYWQSPLTNGKYPIKWQFSIPKKNIKLIITPFFKNQELITKKSTRIIYWEGAVKVNGSINNTKITGQGYVEMTGYAKITRQ